MGKLSCPALNFIRFSLGGSQGKRARNNDEVCAAAKREIEKRFHFIEKSFRIRRRKVEI